MVGEAYAEKLEKLGIETVEDLLHHYPFRYEDWSFVSKIGGCQPGEKVTLYVTILSIKNVFARTGKRMQKAVVADRTGQMEITWFNQPFLVKNLKPGTKVALAGKVDTFGTKKQMVAPEHEIIKVKSQKLKVRSYYSNNYSYNNIHTGRLVPVYPETAGVSSKWLRSRIAPLVKKLVPQMQDYLPLSIRKQFAICDLPRAIRSVHFPKDKKAVAKARKRLGFDELLFLHLKALSRKSRWQSYQATKPFKFDQEKINKFIKKLPFELTGAQKKAVSEILKDLQKQKPMNRLLEGDVGSGKTIVAAIAAYAAHLSGIKTGIMAPTEILAEQHFQTFKKLFKPFGLKIELITGSHKSQITNHKSQIAITIGTHALLWQKFDHENLGLVVIDEQHRFGVAQRAKLTKKGKSPHLLTMTATPIPRTVALTLYADLDLSILDEMPKGRKPVKTWVVPEEKREAGYQWIREKIKEGNQAFIICPLIEPSQSEKMANIKAATEEFEKLSKKIFPDLKLLLLHGRIKSKEKNKIIEKFKAKKADILVSTPVVEVGIDIENATIIVIEAAERFGLAQLHQMRGRVGRGEKQSYCLLFSSDGKATRRLKAMEKYQSGLKLAEIDLKIRGPGEIYGTSQSGFLDLKIASFSDKKLIKKTKQAVEDLFPRLDKLPLLKEELEKVTIEDVHPN